MPIVRKKRLNMNVRRTGRRVAVAFSLLTALLAPRVLAQVDKSGSPAAPAEAASAAAPAPSNETVNGIATVYSRRFAGRKTASGERYSPDALTAAHNTLPLGTRVKVTGVQSRRSVVVVITDRGPNTAGRIIDLSSTAAREIGMVRSGLREVSLEVLSPPAAQTARTNKTAK